MPKMSKSLFCLVLFSIISLACNSQAKEYSRIISMGPSVTESLFALGCGDLLVGVSDYCNYPPAALDKARVGGVLNPNLERYAALQPDLVILRGNLEKIRNYCKSRNIAILETDMDSVQGITRTITLLGTTLGAEARAQSIIQDMEAELFETVTKVKGLSRPKVFICVGRTPGGLSSIYTCSKASFVSQVLEMAGGENVFSDIPTAYPEVSKESLMRREPDVILDMRPGETFSPSEKERMVLEWGALRTLPAVKNGKVFIMTQDFLLLPGPRVGKAAMAIANAIHGGLEQEQ